MDGIKGTKENLEAAMAGEVFEFQKMYPQMILRLRPKATRMRSGPSTTPMKSRRSIRNSIRRPSLNRARMRSGLLCLWVCGHTVEDEPPDECPVCKSKKQAYKKVE